MKRSYLILTILLLSFSCKKEIANKDGGVFVHKKGGNSVLRTFVDIPTSHPYFLYLKSSNFLLCYTTENTIIPKEKGYKKSACPSVSGSSGKADEDNNREMLINGISFKYNSSKGTYTNNEIQREELCNKFISFYGNEVEFTCLARGKNIIVKKIYIPSILEMSNLYGNLANSVPKVTGAIPLMWNADPNNKNGVVIIVRAEDNLSGKNIENIAFAKDNGNYTISGDLLKNISQGMSITVKVLRGNIFTATDDLGYIYKGFAYSVGTQNFYYGI